MLEEIETNSPLLITKAMLWSRYFVMSSIKSKGTRSSARKKKGNGVPPPLHHCIYHDAHASLQKKKIFAVSFETR